MLIKKQHESPKLMMVSTITLSLEYVRALYLVASSAADLLDGPLTPLVVETARLMMGRLDECELKIPCAVMKKLDPSWVE